MKKFSKLFWVALVVVAVLACTAIGIFAADTTGTTNAVVYGDFVDLTKVKGDSFDVGFHFKENDTLVECGKITLTWDETKLTADNDSVAIGDALKNAKFGSKVENGKAVIAWAGSNITEEMPTGDLFTVKFTKVYADVTDALIDVTVDDFGYTTEIYKSVDMADTVKVNKAFANNGTTVEMPYAEGEKDYGKPVDFLKSAIEKAESGDGQTVNVVLGADMVFDASTVIGAANSNHVGKVVITSAPVSAEDSTPAYGIKLENNPVVTMYGNYEFSNMLLETESLSTSDRYDNALLFPDDCSAVFGQGITKTESAKPLNIAGNVTVNSGTYCYIAGNAQGSGVKIEKELNITVQGSTVTNYVIGGMIEGAGKGGQVNAKSNVKILDDAQVIYDVIAGGRYTSNSGTAGADVIINTDNTIGRVAAGLGSLSEASVFNIRIVNATITTEEITPKNYGIVAAAIMNDGGTFGKSVEKDEKGEIKTPGTVVNFYIDGGEITQFFGGIFAAYTDAYYMTDLDGDGKNETKVHVGTNGGWYQASEDLNGDGKINADDKIEVPEATLDKAQNDAIMLGEVNIYINKNEEIDDIEYSEPATIDYLYSGSEFNVYKSFDDANRTLNVYAGAKNSNFYGGSRLDCLGASHTGDTVITITGCEDTGDDDAVNAWSIYGGSHILAAGVEHSGSSTVNLINTTLNNTKSGAWSFVHGGSNIRANGTHSGTSTVNLTNYVTSKRVAGASYIQTTQGVHSGESTVNILSISQESPVSSGIFGGSTCYHGTSDTEKYGHRGNSKIVVNLTGSTIFKSTLHGGSLLRGDNKKPAVHAGTSEVEIQAGIIAASIYGGSYQYSRYPEGAGISNGNTAVKFTGTGAKTISGIIYGGARSGDYAVTHIGNSSIVIENGSFSNTLYGGSNFNSANSTHTGTSSVTLNGGTVTGPVYGGSYATNKATNARQIGASSVTINGAELTNYCYAGLYSEIASAALIGSTTLTVNEGSTVKQLIGASRFYKVHATNGDDAVVDNPDTTDVNEADALGADKIKYGFGQTGDSTVIIKSATVNGLVHGGGMRCNINGNIYINISGNSVLNADVYGTSRITTDESEYCSITGNVEFIISGGTFDKGVQGAGAATRLESPAGSKKYIYYSSKTGLNVTKGYVYMEISGGEFKNYIETSGGSGANQGSYLKLIGEEFNISAARIWTNGWSGSAALTDEAGNSARILDLSLMTNNKGKYTAWFTNGLKTNMGTTGERGFSKVYPSLADASEISATMTNTTFNYGEKLVLTKDDTLNIKYANPVYYNTSTTTVNSFDDTYGTLTAWDDFASCEEAKTANAIKFYLYNTEESTVGEQITVAPAVSNPSVVVGVGNVYSAPIALTVEGLSVSGTITNAESAVTVHLIKDEEVAYQATVEPTDGSAAYAIDFVSEGTYTLKVTSEGYNIYTKEITVTAEDLTEDVVLKAKAVFPTTGGMTASLNLIDEIKINFDYELVGMADLNINDFDPAKFGLLVWQTAKFDGKLDPTTAIHSAINTKNGDEILTGSEVVYELDENTKYPHGRWRTTTPGIPAAKWGDTITIRPFYLNEDGTYSYGRVINYSVRQYCMNKINNNKPEKALCVSILNYGAAAQTYFNYNPTALMNAEMAPELQTFDWSQYEQLVTLDYSVSSTKEGQLKRDSKITLRRGSVGCEGILNYNFMANVNFEPVSVKAYFWTQEDYNKYDVLTLENASSFVDATPYIDEGDACYIGSYTRVPAAYMFKNVYGCLVFEAADGSLTYSGVVAYSPARFAYINRNDTQNKGPLAKAIAVYGATAKEYFGV